MNEFEFDLRENRTNPDLNVVNHSASLSLFYDNGGQEWEFIWSEPSYLDIDGKLNCPFIGSKILKSEETFFASSLCTHSAHNVLR